MTSVCHNSVYAHYILQHLMHVRHSRCPLSRLLCVISSGRLHSRRVRLRRDASESSTGFGCRRIPSSSQGVSTAEAACSQRRRGGDSQAPHDSALRAWTGAKHAESCCSAVVIAAALQMFMEPSDIVACSAASSRKQRRTRPRCHAFQLEKYKAELAGLPAAGTGYLWRTWFVS